MKANIRLLNTHIRLEYEEEEIENLGEIDILILPVGNTVLSASQASKVVNEIEPKVSCHYKMAGLIFDLDKRGKIYKNGRKKEMEKLTLKKRFAGRGVKVVVLEPLR